MSDNNPYASESEVKAPTGNLSILTNIFTAPANAMTQVQERYSVAFPLLLTLVLSSVIWIAYYQMIDYQWFVDYSVEASAGDLSKAEQDQVRKGMEMMSPSIMAGSTAVFVAIFMALVYVVQAVYFLIVSNVNGDGYQFKQWLSFVSWASMPILLAILAMFVMLLTSANGQIAPDDLNPLSLNALFFGLDGSKGLGKLLASIHLAQIWSIAVMVIGYQIWTKKSAVASALIVASPYVLIYLGWFLFFID